MQARLRAARHDDGHDDGADLSPKQPSSADPADATLPAAPPNFHSILFPDSDAAALPAVAAPEFFRDLNLDQLVAAIVVARHDYDLTPFFHAPLAGLDAPIAFPQPAPAGARTYECAGLYDVCLALSMRRRIVGNALHADGKSLVVITGANQGGKSSFLRGVGLAHLMMQAGMFVAAESFGAALCTALFTHYKREEDVAMKKGKLDEELSRMSDIAAALTPDALVLFNESFAATNEREGAEIAGQVVRALLEQRVRIFFVTHLYAFAHGAHERLRPDAVFLRAERLADGTRTFKLAAAEPLETSYGVDVYREVFAEETEEGTP